MALLGVKLGGMVPLKLLYWTNLFHIVESPMSQLVRSLSTAMHFFIRRIIQIIA